MTQILVIEDDPTQRLLTSSVLRSAGYEVKEAEDGSQGLAKARQDPPDLIVCDVVMPGLDGYEVVALLRKELAFSITPVILLTAMADRSHMRRGMTAGADDYLHKPFRAAELRRSVEALLAKRDLQRRQFAHAGESQMMAALDQQKESLAARYEKRLMQELNARWVDQAGADLGLTFSSATVLVVNLFSTVFHHRVPAHLLGGVVQRVYQAASDSLYLFGARHLVPMGDDLVAIFPEDSPAGTLRTRLLALRGAFGMQKMTQAAFESLSDASNEASPHVPALTIALHAGPAALLVLKDPLHGGQTLTLALGEAVYAAKAIGRLGHADQWRVSCSSELIAGIPDWVAQGRKAFLPGDQGFGRLEAVELMAVAQA